MRFFCLKCLDYFPLTDYILRKEYIMNETALLTILAFALLWRCVQALENMFMGNLNIKLTELQREQEEKPQSPSVKDMRPIIPYYNIEDKDED